MATTCTERSRPHPSSVVSVFTGIAPCKFIWEKAPIPFPHSWRLSISLTLQTIIFFLFFFLLLTWPVFRCFRSNDLFAITSPTVTRPRGIEHLWGQYSPYSPVESYQTLPPNCKVTQVNIIQRHGARFPTTDVGSAIKSAIAKLQNAQSYADPRLDFLTNYTYHLGQDDLVSFGASEAFQAGGVQFERYAGLANSTNLPFVRATSSKRVLDSAKNWTAGFATASRQSLIPNVSLIIDETLNNTLANKMCPNAGSSDEQTDLWRSIFTPAIASRLNLAAPGANITGPDIPHLMSMCPFETVAENKTSRFCALFSKEEFEAFEYYGDLNKFYGFGYGQALGPVQGVGYVNELLSRLTGKPVQDHTQTNNTLDSSPITFPLDRTIYVDFSHDNTMTAMYAAIGLFRQSHLLDPSHPDPHRTWVASRLVPFSGRMVTEKVTCNLGRHGGGYKEYVRVLVNDGVQPLLFCGGSHGLCSLDAFVQSQGYARSDGAGDFDKCYG